MADVLVVGSLNADLVVRTARFPSPGETIQGNDLAIIPGGKGANQAFAVSRLGANVAMVGRVGMDVFGTNLIENLKHNKVDTSRVLQDDSAATGTAVIVVDAQGQNSIVLSPGANGKVSPSDAESALFGGPSASSGQGASLLLLQFEIPIETVVHAARLAKEKGLRVLLNPAPAHAVPDELLRSADFLLPNETELRLLTGQPVSDLASAETAARLLISRGAANVIVTLGANGALIVNAEGAKHIPSFKVDVVDTTAAGDAFIGGFATALLAKKPLEEAVQFACACGAVAVTRFGAQPSLPTAVEAQTLLQENNTS
jgi:ribokinase